MGGPEVGYLPVPPMKLLRERVASAITYIPFYRNLYVPFCPIPQDDDDFLEWFATLPIVNKSQLQAAGTAELLNPTYKRSELVLKATSGSTGVPFNLLLSNTVVNFRKWRFQRPHQCILNEPPTKLVFIFPWDFVARTPREELRLAAAAPGVTVSGNGDPEQASAPSEAAEQGLFSSLPKKTKRTAKTTGKEGVLGQEAPVLNRPFTVNSWLPLEQLFAALHELAPATLIGFASSLATLARWMLLHDEHIPSLKQVWTTSEVISPEGADAIRGAMGCEPLTIYASNEFGFMAWEAQVGRPMCFDSDRLHVECIARDRPGFASCGDLSRIVVTDLLNDTTPLIRYDIADIARPCEPIQVTGDLRCAAITDLQGKEADLLQPPDGRIVTTFQVLGAIKDHLPNAQYRLVGIRPDQYVLQYCPGPGFSTSSVEPTIQALREIFRTDIEVIPQQVCAIAREPSGKLRPLVNLQNVSEGQRRSLAAELGVSSLLKTDGRTVAASIVARALALVKGMQDPHETLDELQELYADLALDSLQFVTLVAEFERELDRDIDDEDLLDVDLITVGDLVTFIERMLVTT